MANVDFVRSSDNVITNEFVHDVASFEGFYSRPYRCPAGVLTIGFGHTSNVKKSDRITLQQAYNLLYEDLMSCYYDLKKHYIVDAWTIGMKQCFIDFVFNCGIKTLLKSSMHPYLLGFDFPEPVNRGHALKIIKDILSKYVYAGNKRLYGLERRRNFECKLLNLFD